MFGFMVTADGGLTTAGYVITVIAGIILFFLAIYFAGKNSDKKKLTTRQLVWGWNRYYGRVCLRNPAVYPGALYTFIFSGML